MKKDDIYASIIIPVYNEEETLHDLYARLSAVLKGLHKTCEIIFVDDGSSDRSFEMIRQLSQEDPSVKPVELVRNYGQHAAVFAGFEKAKGSFVITMDADLQNPPEEIPRLLEKLEAGYEVVGTIRKNRQDSIVRRMISHCINKAVHYCIGVSVHDLGSMLRGYTHSVVGHMCRGKEYSTFIPVLAYGYAKRIIEIDVAHEERKKGKSKYNIFKLISLQFDLITSFSSVPLRFLIYFGFVVSGISLGFGVFLGIRRLIVGPEVEGVFTLFALLFFLVGCVFFAFGLLGEYISRIYVEVRKRPRYVIREADK